MSNLKPIIAANLAQLRKEKGLTQAELAERFNYSDKAISRWERGDTLPEIDVLFDLCLFYGITLDELVQEGCTQAVTAPEKDALRSSKISVCAMVITIIWLAATCIFTYELMFKDRSLWQVFIYAIPVSCLFLQLLIRRFRLNLPAVYLNSAIIWTCLGAVYIYFLGDNVWPVFIIGIPAQIATVLWHRIRSYRG